MLQTAGAPLGVTQSKQEKLNKVLFGSDKSKYFGPSDREYLDFLDQFFPSNVANYTREKLYNSLLNVPVLRDYLIQRGQPRSGAFLDEKTLGDGVTIRSLLDDGINEMRSQQYRDTSANDKAILASDYLPKTKVPITSKYAPVQITKNAEQTAARIADRLDIDAPSLRDSIAIKLRSFESPDEAKRYLDNLLGEDGYVAPEFFTETIKEGVPLSQANRLVFNVIKTGRVLLDKRDFLYQEEFSQALNDYTKAREAFERTDIKHLFDGVKHSRPLRKLEEDYDTAMQIIDQITANLAAIKQYGNELPHLADVKNMEDTRLEEMRKIAEARRERMELARQEREAEEKERLDKIARENEKLRKERETQLALEAALKQAQITDAVSHGDISKKTGNLELLRLNFETAAKQIINDLENPSDKINFEPHENLIRDTRSKFVDQGTEPSSIFERAYITDKETHALISHISAKMDKIFHDTAGLNFFKNDPVGAEYLRLLADFINDMNSYTGATLTKFYGEKINHAEVDQTKLKELDAIYPGIEKFVNRKPEPLDYLKLAFPNHPTEQERKITILDLALPGIQSVKAGIEWMYGIYENSDKDDKDGIKFQQVMGKIIKHIPDTDKVALVRKFIDIMKTPDYTEFAKFLPNAEAVLKIFEEKAKPIVVRSGYFTPYKSHDSTNPSPIETFLEDEKKKNISPETILRNSVKFLNNLYQSTYHSEKGEMFGDSYQFGLSLSTIISKLSKDHAERVRYAEIFNDEMKKPEYGELYAAFGKRAIKEINSQKDELNDHTINEFLKPFNIENSRILSIALKLIKNIQNIIADPSNVKLQSSDLFKTYIEPEYRYINNFSSVIPLRNAMRAVDQYATDHKLDEVVPKYYSDLKQFIERFEKPESAIEIASSPHFSQQSISDLIRDWPEMKPFVENRVVEHETYNKQSDAHSKLFGLIDDSLEKPAGEVLKYFMAHIDDKIYDDLGPKYDKNSQYYNDLITVLSKVDLGQSNLNNAESFERFQAKREKHAKLFEPLTALATSPGHVSPAGPATMSPGHVSPAGPASPRSSSPATSTPVIPTFDEQIEKLNRIIVQSLAQSKDVRVKHFNLLIDGENKQDRLVSIDPEIIKLIEAKIEKLDSKKKGSINADERYEITKIVSDYKDKTEKEAADKAAADKAAADKAAAEKAAADKAAADKAAAEKAAAEKAAAEKAAAEKAAAEKEAADKLKAEALAQAISLIENSFAADAGDRVNTFDSLDKDKLDPVDVDYLRKGVEEINVKDDQTEVDEAKSELLKFIKDTYEFASGVIKPRRKPAAKSAAKPAAKSAAKPAAKPAAKKQPKAAPKKSAKLFN